LLTIPLMAVLTSWCKNNPVPIGKTFQSIWPKWNFNRWDPFKAQHPEWHTWHWNKLCNTKVKFQWDMMSWVWKRKVTCRNFGPPQRTHFLGFEEMCWLSIPCPTVQGSMKVMWFLWCCINWTTTTYLAVKSPAYCAYCGWTKW
jgi:hypothetical protein